MRRTWGSYATLTPHQIDFEKEKNNNNDKTTVLQSASGQEPGGSHALFLRIVARGYLKIRYVPDPTFELCACLITTLCVYIAPRKISFDSKPDDSKQTLWILRFERMNRRWPIRTMIGGYLHLYQVKYIDGKLPALTNRRLQRKKSVMKGRKKKCAKTKECAKHLPYVDMLQWVSSGGLDSTVWSQYSSLTAFSSLALISSHVWAGSSGIEPRRTAKNEHNIHK